MDVWFYELIKYKSLNHKVILLFTLTIRDDKKLVNIAHKAKLVSNQNCFGFIN